MITIHDMKLCSWTSKLLYDRCSRKTCWCVCRLSLSDAISSVPLGLQHGGSGARGSTASAHAEQSVRQQARHRPQQILSQVSSHFQRAVHDCRYSIIYTSALSSRTITILYAKGTWTPLLSQEAAFNILLVALYLLSFCKLNVDMVKIYGSSATNLTSHSSLHHFSSFNPVTCRCIYDNCSFVDT